LPVLDLQGSCKRPGVSEGPDGKCLLVEQAKPAQPGLNKASPEASANEGLENRQRGRLGCNHGTTKCVDARETLRGTNLTPIGNQSRNRESTWNLPPALL